MRAGHFASLKVVENARFGCIAGHIDCTWRFGATRTCDSTLMHILNVWWVGADSTCSHTRPDGEEASSAGFLVPLASIESGQGVVETVAVNDNIAGLFCPAGILMCKRISVGDVPFGIRFVSIMSCGYAMSVTCSHSHCIWG